MFSSTLTHTKTPHRIEHFYQLIEMLAEDTKTQNRIAIYSDDENKITYQALNSRVNQLAHYLLDPKNKVNFPETQIGLFFHLSIEYVICQLAIMKAGLSFVAFSANTEVDRLQEFVKQSQIKLILSSSDLKNHLFLTTSQSNIFYFDIQQNDFNPYPISNPTNKVMLNQLCYIHNTSGSTGKPKQVLINHAGLLNCATDLINRLNVTEHDKTAAFADISFDAHIAEMMMTLGAGAALYLVPAQTRLNYLSLTQYYNSHGITVSTLTPSVLNVLTPNAFPSLKVLISTGEAVTQRIVAKWCAANPNLLFVNGYGPAEVTIATSIAILNPGDPIHIGTPIKGLTMYVLEKEPKDGNPPKWVPPGERGEMYIGGAGVGRGYADEALTAERFKIIPNPDKPDEIIRLYQTRDEAKYEINADNSYLYYVTGRLDRQVKVYGKLICPEEIELLLLNEQVIQAQIDPQKTPEGHPAFIAYLYVNKSFDLYEYYASVVKKFPAATAPARWVISDKVLLSNSGKNALKSLDLATVRAQSHSALQPKTPLEIELAQIWKNVLEISEEITFTLDDNFFMLGGTSLQMASLLVLLREQYHLKLNPTEFTYVPTIGSLARRINRLKNADKRLNVPVLLNPKHAILHKETPLFLIHSLLGDAELDYAKLIDKWPSQRPIYGINSRSFNHVDDMDTNLEAIAYDYIEAMKSIQPRGPYLLGGWSAGGLIAYAMCQILKSETVYLHMIDTEALATYRHKSREEYADYLLLLFEIKLNLMLGLSTTPVSKATLALLPKTKQIYYFFDALQIAVEKSALEITERTAILIQRKIGLICTIKNTLLAILNYPETNKIENVILWAASETQKKCADINLRWMQSEIEFTSVRELDGNHESIILDPISAKTLSVQLERECTQQIEAKKQIQTLYFNRPSINSTNFIDRDNALNDLHKIFHRLGRNQDIAIISHPKCVGKSSVAEQYMNHNHLEYELKLWFRAENKKVLLEDYEKLARQLNLVIVANNAEEAVKLHLENRRNWLAVYDNAAPLKEIKNLLPNNGGHIIITTQFQEWINIGLDIGIDYLPAADCLSLLQTISNQNDLSETNAQNSLIADLRLPLAIAQLGTYLKKSTQTPTKFLAYLQIEREATLNSNAASAFYKKNLSYGILIDSILAAVNNDMVNDQQLKYSLVILQALAHLHTSGGSYSILKLYLQQINPAAPVTNLEVLLDKSIEHLLAYSLIQYDFNRRVISINNSTQEMLKQHSLPFSNKPQNILFLITALHLARKSADLIFTNLTVLAANIKQFAPAHFQQPYVEIYAELSEMYANKLNPAEAMANTDKILKVSERLDDSQLVLYYRLHQKYIEALSQHKLTTFKKIISCGTHTDNLLKSFYPKSKMQADIIKLKRVNLILKSLVPALIKIENYSDCIIYLDDVINLIQQLQASAYHALTKEKLNAYLLQAKLFKTDVICQHTRRTPSSETYILPPACFELVKLLEVSPNSKKYLAHLHHQIARLKMIEAEDNNYSLPLYEEAWESFIVTCNLRFEIKDFNQIIPLLNDMALCCYHLNDTTTQFYLNALALVIYKKYFIHTNHCDDMAKIYEMLAMLNRRLAEPEESNTYYLELAKFYYSIPEHHRAIVIKKDLDVKTALSAEQIAKLTNAHKKSILNKIYSLNEFLLKKRINLGEFREELLEIGSELSKLNWDEPALRAPLTPNQNTFFSAQQPKSLIIKNIQPNLPWPQNPLFTGREEFLALIDKSLSPISGHQKSIVFTIHGMSGTGKSQIAVHFAHHARLTRKYKLIWYLSAVNLTDGFLELSDAFNIPLNEPPPKRIAAAKTYLQNNYSGNCLLIIDDAVDYGSIQSLFLEISGAHFLVTSKNAAEWTLKKELFIFNRAESLSVIEKVLTTEAEKNFDDANELADLLGDLPLALAQACSYIQANCSISDYIDLYTKQRNELWSSEQAPRDYPSTVAVTFELAFKNVKKFLPIRELEEFLGYCIYLHQDSIPKWLLKTTIANPVIFAKIIQTLTDFSLIQASEDRISLHKILQQVMRDKLRDTSHKVITLLIAESMSNDSTVSLAKNRELLEHYDAVLETNPECVDSLKLFFIAGLTHLRLGNPHKASVLFNSAIRLKAADTEHDLEFAMILDYLGTAYGEIGLPQLKKETLLRSLDVKLSRSKLDTNFTPDHPEFARTYNNLANAYGAENNLLMQLFYLEKAYQIQVNTVGEKDPEAALVQANLAVVYNCVGQKNKAKKYFEQALLILKTEYGANHYHVGRLLNNWASLLGPMEWAATLNQYTVDIDINPGGLIKCRIINCAEKQKELLEEAVRIQTQNYGEKNINVALIQSNLVKVYGTLCLWSKQKTLLKSIIPIFEKFYGSDNVQANIMKEKLTEADSKKYAHNP
ncbi:MAG: AMP-binding protein [Pseudomonadota bacterium]